MFNLMSREPRVECERHRERKSIHSTLAFLQYPRIKHAHRNIKGILRPGRSREFFARGRAQFYYAIGRQPADRTLEDKFKRRLLERVRGRREVKLTPAGDVFYEESKKVLAAYDQLQENLRGVVGKIGGTVKVATVYSVGIARAAGQGARIYDEISRRQDRSRIFAHDASRSGRTERHGRTRHSRLSRTASRPDDHADAG